MAKAPVDVPLELQSLVRQLHGAHIVINADYTIVAANDAYRESFQQAGEVVGRKCYEVSHGYAVPCDQAGESCPRLRAMLSGHYERVLHVHHTARGEEYVQVHLYPLHDGRGAVSLFVEQMTALPAARATSSSQGLVGRAPAFVAMMESVSRVARTDTAVLLLGETGTGKEMVARAIHAASKRADAPFVASDPVLATGAGREPPERFATERTLCGWIEEPRRIAARGWWLRHDALAVGCSPQAPLRNVPARRVEPVVIWHARENHRPSAGCPRCRRWGAIRRATIKCARLVLCKLQDRLRTLECTGRASDTAKPAIYPNGEPEPQIALRTEHDRRRRLTVIRSEIVPLRLRT